MKRPLTTVISCVTASLLATSCMTLGPDYTEPAAPLETNWLEYEDPRISNAAPVEGEWWTLAFNDPTLVQLVDTALAENLTLRSAGLRVLQARQQLAIAIGNQYPQQQDVTGSAGKDRRNDVTDEIYDLGFNVSWEADVWGRFRRQIESASAVLDASVAGYDGVLISLVADVAETYLLIRTTQQRLLVAQHNVGLQRESARISQAKFDSGEVRSLDVAQASTLLYNTIASVGGRSGNRRGDAAGSDTPSSGHPGCGAAAGGAKRTNRFCDHRDFSGTSSTTGASGATLDCRTRFFSSCWKTTARPCCRRRPTSRIPSSPT
jgi:hypothetical protein